MFSLILTLPPSLSLIPSLHPLLYTPMCIINSLHVHATRVGVFPHIHRLPDYGYLFAKWGREGNSCNK